ncbi:SRPBCC domain-containing protein [Chitinophaga qingshengii]|uniref:SRPBCC domain-containing protein n=1 Tax=Chitinophaga qingshengii TaxID=1569794 RepID=A0ABR7TJI6_9BACT|nr:SRPBCC domain-containing protein [Chitinophaga qingshengii]MBC9930635.1 SRPBCC domain-containing protein [Chitinophaga qingshengii]
MTYDKNTLGHTTSQGWEMGVRRTFALTPEAAWETLFTQPILGIWLDKAAHIAFQKNDTYTTASGITITVTSVTTVKVIRMKWQQQGQPNASTLQIRVIPAKDKTTISFHHEWLTGQAEREAMKTYWTRVLDAIGQTQKNS